MLAQLATPDAARGLLNEWRMRRVRFLAVLGLLGCSETEPVEGEYIDVFIDHGTVDGIARVDLFYGLSRAEATAIATPAILAGTDPPAGAISSWRGGPRQLARSQDSYDYRLWEVVDFNSEIYLGVVAFAGDGAVLGAASGGEIIDPDRRTLELTLDPAQRPEVWGPPGTTDGSMRCYRLPTAEAVYFVTTSGDRDCDGISDGQDSQPTSYCDPAATSERARDACR